ncbi:MAG: glycosyltransferase family 39 protein [Elusimicrobia bacterium]|nr:glycosyltransferase family 39 protein [Elusimicrobiota bacterium]
MRKDPSAARFSWRRALALFLLAFAVRAVFLAQWSRLPYIDAPRVDAQVHHDWALEILHGRLIRERAFYQSPFYPYLLAAGYKLFGIRPHAMLWLQAAVDASSCVVIMSLSELCLGAGAGIVGGLFAAFYRPLIFSTGLMTKETFVVLGLALFALMLLRADASDRRRDYFLCGAALGWTVLSRANVLLLVPAALLWLWLRRRRPPRARNALGFLFGLMLPILPATAHNLMASRDWVLVNYTGGFTFFIGNNPEATGLGHYPLGIDSDPLLEEAQSTRLAEKTVGRALKPSEVSSFWFRKGLDFIAGNPGRWLRLTWTKFRFFWNRYENPDNYDLQFIQEHFSTLLKWPLASFALIGSLGAVGLFLSRLEEPSGLLALLFWSYLASILPFWMSDRYRLPDLVFLIPLAAAALVRLAAALGQKDWRPVWKACLAASPLVFLCLTTPLPDLRSAEAKGWGQLATIYVDLKEPRLAVEAFQRASQLDPASIETAAFIGAASALERLGEIDKSLELYEVGIAVHPGSAMLYNNRGTLLFKKGKVDEGLKLLKKAVEVDPELGLGYRNLFYGYAIEGKRDLALRYGDMAVARLPQDAELKRRLDELKAR